MSSELKDIIIQLSDQELFRESLRSLTEVQVKEYEFLLKLYYQADTTDIHWNHLFKHSLESRDVPPYIADYLANVRDDKRLERYMADKID